MAEHHETGSIEAAQGVVEQVLWKGAEKLYSEYLKPKVRPYGNSYTILQVAQLAGVSQLSVSDFDRQVRSVENTRRRSQHKMRLRLKTTRLEWTRTTMSTLN